MAYSVFVVYTVQVTAFRSPHKWWHVHSLSHSFSKPGKGPDTLQHVVVPFVMILEIDITNYCIDRLIPMVNHYAQTVYRGLMEQSMINGDTHTVYNDYILCMSTVSGIENIVVILPEIY